MVKLKKSETKTLVAGQPMSLVTKATSARNARVKFMNDARKAHVLAIAQEVFIEKGLDGASMRQIAKQAGYTPGAIYSYFASKEELYGALLAESLKRLIERVVLANATTGATSSTTASLCASAQAFFGFYHENPRDLDLGFYLFQGMKPRGLTPELNDALNTSLRDALAPIRDALLTMGLSEAQAQAEITGLFAQVVGLLLLSHTGRIRMFKQDPEDLFAVYLDSLLTRIAKAD